MKNFKKLFFDHIILAITLIAILTCSLFAWIFGNQDISNLGLNLFTEILGVVITVYIINYIIELKENRNRIPYRLTIYKDVHQIFGSIVTIFNQAYRTSVPEEHPKLITDFLTRDGMGKVMKYLDLNSKPNVTPERTWYQYFKERKIKVNEHGIRYLERHDGHTDPELYKSVHTIVNGRFFSQFDMIPALLKVASNNNRSFIMSFKSFAMDFSDAEYAALNYMNKWLVDNQKELNKIDSSIKLLTYKSKYSGEQNTKCKLPDELIEH